MKYEWTGGPLIWLYSDPGGMTVASVAEDNIRAIGWNAFDLTSDGMPKLGSYKTLEQAKAAVETWAAADRGKLRNSAQS